MMDDSLYVLNAYVAIELNKAHKIILYTKHTRNLSPLKQELNDNYVTQKIHERAQLSHGHNNITSGFINVNKGFFPVLKHIIICDSLHKPNVLELYVFTVQFENNKTKIACLELLSNWMHLFKPKKTTHKPDSRVEALTFCLLAC